MESIQPQSPEELAATLAELSSAGRTINLGGAFTKLRMGGPVTQADATVSTARMNRVLKYEPRDLTISVEAGTRWADLRSLLAGNRQMIPLDPSFGEGATVGGMLAANTCGPRRRLYGSARDWVIGMKFATLEGKLAQSGGMVVKNVAGLDMAKLMIGSFGTLAAIAVANFKLAPMPAATRTFVLAHETIEQALATRDKALSGALQPAAVDLLSPQAAGRVGSSGWTLAIGAGGNAAAMERSEREFPRATVLEGAQEQEFWRKIEEFTPRFLGEHPGGAVARVSATRADLPRALKLHAGPALARAGNGIVYACFEQFRAALDWLTQATQQGLRVVIESGPESRNGEALWPLPGSDFAMMKRIKEMFDPKYLLNRGRLYGRL
jgi:glycolate oxidase FAD binding subunit